MKKILFFVVISILLSTPVMAVAREGIDPEIAVKGIETEMESIYGPADIGPETVVEIDTKSISPSCIPVDVDRDPATAGPITVNTQYVSVSSSFCEGTNTAVVNVGSRWWGLEGKTQRVFGFLSIRDENEVLIDFVSFDKTNNPLTDGALNIHPNWTAPYGDEIYRFDLEVNLRMLPDNVGPGTLKVTWYYQAQPYRVYLPNVVKSSPPNCKYQLHIKGMYGVDEFYCFSEQGNAYAMLHFGHSEIVSFEWVDQDHKVLSTLPPGGFCRLTWWDGYKDFYTPTFPLQATLWPKNGPPPWLAVEYMMNCQFSENGVYQRVTVPMIWDP